MNITITPEAIEEIRKIKTAQNLDDTTFLRLGITGGGCSGITYSLNFDKDFDAILDTKYVYEGIDIVTQKKFEPHFFGTEIGFVDSPLGKGFSVENPNFPKLGGCPGCGGH